MTKHLILLKIYNKALLLGQSCPSWRRPAAPTPHGVRNSERVLR